MRDDFWDIVKGLGIIAVVTAHATIFSIELNRFHLPLFFFVSGFLFSAKKCLDYGNFFLHKFKTLWKPFVLYNALFFVLQNFFISIHWISSENILGTMISQHISFYEVLKQIVSVFFIGNINIMCGATWFMAPFAVNILLFGLLVKISNERHKYLLPFLILLFFVIGTAVIKHSPGMYLYTDMAMMLLPITAAGFYLKKFCVAHNNVSVSEIISFHNKKFAMVEAIIFVISAAVFYYLETNKIVIGLAGYGMGNWFLFISAALAGTFFTVLAAKIISSVNVLKKIFAFIGRESFHIMALHFIGFKILSSIYVLTGGQDYNLMAFYILPEIPLFLYVVFGIGISLLLRKIFQQTLMRLNF